MCPFMMWIGFVYVTDRLHDNLLHCLLCLHDCIRAIAAVELTLHLKARACMDFSKTRKFS